MTKYDLDDFEFSLNESLFHVMSDDKEENGVAVEELILIQHISSCPWVLSFHPLTYWVDKYCGKCYSADIKRQNDEILANQRNNKTLTK